MLSRELNQFSETSKSANEVSEYICNTFLGRFDPHYIISQIHIEGQTWHRRSDVD